ncbi:MAG TPA: hypothetical protein VFH74_14095 [Gaiellales bacterium]|nr:hypothetical protein [Gaiellales bacterium]
MEYQPVDDYLRQRGGKHDDLSPEEKAFLETLTAEEVAALVALDNKARDLALPPDQYADFTPVVFSVGAHSY